MKSFFLHLKKWAFLYSRMMLFKLSLTKVHYLEVNFSSLSRIIFCILTVYLRCSSSKNKFWAPRIQRWIRHHFCLWVVHTPGKRWCKAWEEINKSKYSNTNFDMNIKEQLTNKCMLKHTNILVLFYQALGSDILTILVKNAILNSFIDIILIAPCFSFLISALGPLRVLST